VNVLFVCVGNQGRSQMAHAFYEARGGSGRSAGTRPGDAVHPEVVEVMRERGLDVATRTPHKLDEDDVRWAEVVVTMGCGDACPVLPGKRYVDWNLTDPMGLPLDDVRTIRDEIERRVADLPGGDQQHPE